MFREKDVPDWADESVNGMFAWWHDMAEKGLAFHPDDPPSSIVFIETGKPMFSKGARSKLEGTFCRMHELHGGRIYDAGFEALKERLGFGCL